MSTLLIAYDLSDAASVNGPLAAAIMRLGSRWARPLSTLWFIETAATPADIEAALAPWIDAEDGLVVQAVAGEAALANTVVRWTNRRMVATDLTQSAGPQTGTQTGSSSEVWPDRANTLNGLPILDRGVAAAA
jgi:hypothetical protein